MIDTRLLFNRDTVLGDGVAQAGEVHLVPARYVRGLLGSGAASSAPGEDIPDPTSITAEDLGMEPEAPRPSRRNR